MGDRMNPSPQNIICEVSRYPCLKIGHDKCLQGAYMCLQVFTGAYRASQNHKLDLAARHKRLRGQQVAIVTFIMIPFDRCAREGPVPFLT